MKLSKSLLLILLFALSTQHSKACINEYRTLLSGEVRFKDAMQTGTIYPKINDTLELRQTANRLLEQSIGTDSIEPLSDYAAALIYLGEYEKAKTIYQQIELRKPNLYTTASNLGTIYELTGKPDSALIWIKKSMELNPQSHHGSEWIHVKILEFKLMESSDYTKSILDLDFGDKDTPENPNNYDLREMQSHIKHQLHERSCFIKPPNAIVGNICFDLGNILAQTNDVQTGLESYEEAITYGYDSPLFQKRMKRFKELADKTKTFVFIDSKKDSFIRNNTQTVIIGLLITSVLGLFILIKVIIWIRKRLNK